MSARDRRRTRPALLALLLLTCLLGLLAPATPAALAAGDAAPTGEPAASSAARTGPSALPTRPPDDATARPDDEDELGVRVQVLEIAPVVLRPGEDLTVRVRLTNTGEDEVTAPRAYVRIERIRPGTRADLETWLAEPAATGSGGRVGTRAATVAADAPLPSGAAVDLTLTVPAGEVGLLDRPDVWGARGLAVEAVDGTRRVGLERTFVLWAPEGAIPQARVSVLAPVVGPPTVPAALEGEATVPGDDLETLAGPGGRLAEVLDVARAHPDVSLAVDPALVASARAADGAAGTWSQDLLTVAAGRDVMVLPWGDPDLTALAHAGTPDLLQAAVERSRAATVGGTTQDAALAGRTDVLWAPGPTTDQATADLAAEAGAEVLVLAPGDLPTRTGEPSGARTDDAGDGLVGLVPDEVLTELLVDPVSLDPDATPATVVQRVLAELSVVARASGTGPQHLLVAPPRGWTPDREVVDATLAAVQSAPWSRLSSLSSLLGAPSDTTAREPLPALTEVAAALPAEQVRRLAEARAGTQTFASVTTDPDAIVAGVDEAVLTPLATAWRVDPPARAEVVDAVVTEVDARRTGLELAQTSTQNIISASGEVRFSVRNGLPADATVQVRTTPRKACLRAGESATVVVPAGGEAAVPVPVHATANCEVEVEAVLTSADGTPLSAPVTFLARVTPTIESVGTGVVGVLLAVGLVLGIVRTVRRGQSARRGARRVREEEGTRPLPVLGGTPEGDA
ncbi:DUF6049 family protein [Cellulomonas shaoxiangyii]|uniref:Uncharacterized protein n=1 Tax=Cellulomonas shaoxiangyii TaxID=2566013 RepID=A0A4P7SLF0_9CELL|nr:DUF6049 family protein [Cellulomonas shaoxiangyii]QCB95052.1 hypothetical protein E5225_17270 [Cellulomonas shaoxiangyii]TGY86381.1 hypothetical protein E5226_02355 [Cellulomonas shaoxiangyii]